MATKDLGVSLLRQDDDRWKNEKLGNGNNTIGGFGCALTSFTMIYNYWVKSKIISAISKNVSEMNTYLKNNGAFNKSSINFTTAASLFGFSTTSIGDTQSHTELADYNNRIIDLINDEKPVIVGFYNPNSSYLTHFPTAYKHSSGKVLMRDSAKGLDYSIIQKFIDNGFTLYSITYFDLK